MFLVIFMKHNLDLGQHFMTDEELLKRIAKISEIRPTDAVLEIGSGKGALTKHLHAAKPKSLTCIEKDPRFILPVPSKLITGDALDELKHVTFNKVVANIPYHISEPLFIKLLLKKPERMILVVGKKFAQKLLEDTIVGLIARGAYEVRLVETISKESFFPLPKTQSALIIATLKPTVAAKVLIPFYTHQRQKVKNYILTVSEGIWTKREIRERMVGLGDLLTKQLYTLNTKEFAQLYAFLLTLV